MKKQGKKRQSSAQQPKRALARIPEEAPGSEAGGRIEMVPEESSEPAPDASDRAASRSVPGEDRLALPEGGLVAMRRSGGLRFTSRTVIVFRNGRVTSQDRTGPAAERTLDDQELAALYRALDDAFQDLPATTGRQNPDAYAYELVADIEGSERSGEVFDGSMPRQVQPLIRLLSSYARP